MTLGQSHLLFPVPCSLFPVPCSLFPTPYSLLPTPYSLTKLLQKFSKYVIIARFLCYYIKGNTKILLVKSQPTDVRALRAGSGSPTQKEISEEPAHRC
ncbi:hypothetical protein [Moorena sp. SIOASIH]|uniref:hypothetical protein n=1 Tax=Moorena sp. SIOASIH TaxID=2607817 RepID=UPI0025FD4610|nr:hypothetical protein [Moorena sp. SIOASIH]